MGCYKRAHSLQYLQWSNVPWTELTLITKTPYALHWRHLEVHKFTSCKLELVVMLIHIAFLSVLGGVYPFSDECNLLSFVPSS